MTTVIAVSRPGSLVAERIGKIHPDWSIITPPYTQPPDSQSRSEGPWSTRAAIEGSWTAGEPLVLIGAVAIAVRLVAPLMRDKRHDPPVVVVDDAGQWSIALLGGHAAGGNALCQKVAAAIGASPVVTTASDQLGLPSISSIGSDRGWTVQGSRKALLRASAAMVNGEPLGLYQDCGEPYIEERFCHFPTLADLRASGLPEVIITDRLLDDDAVFVRPKTLVVGIGCRRGVPVETIEATVDETLGGHNLAVESVSTIASAELKKDEPGLIALAASRGWQFQTFPAAALAAVVGAPSPSERVARLVGISGVAEPAAMLASGGPLIVPKQKGAATTVAVARLPYRF